MALRTIKRMSGFQSLSVFPQYTIVEYGNSISFWGHEKTGTKIIIAPIIQIICFRFSGFNTKSREFTARQLKGLQ